MLKRTVLVTSFLAFSLIVISSVQEKVSNCPAHLAKQGYKFERVSGYNGAKCYIDQPIKLYATPTTRLTSPVTLSCSFAETFGNWTADVGAESMTHMGGYNCRKIAGSKFMSQHSYGNAIDISKIDGVSIANNWEEPARKACGHFTNILTPATDAAHQDHLHLDKGMGLPCWVRKLKESVSLAF